MISIDTEAPCPSQAFTGADLPHLDLQDEPQPVHILVDYFRDLFQQSNHAACLILPAVSELAVQFGTSTHTILEALRQLKKMGYYNMPAGLYGNITLWMPASEDVKQPVRLAKRPTNHDWQDWYQWVYPNLYRQHSL